MHDSYLFRVLLIPASVFLSVIFGGSYGSGREVMEFISQYGPAGGLLSILVTFATYWVILEEQAAQRRAEREVRVEHGQQHVPRQVQPVGDDLVEQLVLGHLGVPALAEHDQVVIVEQEHIRLGGGSVRIAAQTHTAPVVDHGNGHEPEIIGRQESGQDDQADKEDTLNSDELNGLPDKGTARPP